MKRNKFTSTQIVQILKAFDSGKTVEELSREYVFQDRLFTLGVSAMVVWKQTNFIGLKSLNKRMLV